MRKILFAITITVLALGLAFLYYIFSHSRTNLELFAETKNESLDISERRRAATQLAARTSAEFLSQERLSIYIEICRHDKDPLTNIDRKADAAVAAALLDGLGNHLGDSILLAVTDLLEDDTRG